jgi:hypothetical protein
VCIASSHTLFIATNSLSLRHHSCSNLYTAVCRALINKTQATATSCSITTAAHTCSSRPERQLAAVVTDSDKPHAATHASFTCFIHMLHSHAPSRSPVPAGLPGSWQLINNN